MTGIKTKNIPQDYFNYTYNNSLDDEQSAYDLRIWSELNGIELFE